MSKNFTSRVSDEDAPITAEDVEAGRVVRRHRAQDGRVVLGEGQVPVLIDESIVADFKQRAGEQGYRRLINEVLRESLSGGQG
jgi:uncharacterized protein (DUF4415 family)